MKTFNKVSEQSDERKRQNGKDRKEIEKLKTKNEILTRDKEELNERINTLNKEIGRMNQNPLKKQEMPAQSVATKVGDLDKKPREGVSRSTDVLGMKLKKFGVKQPSPKEETKELTMEEELQQQLQDESMHFDIERNASDSLYSQSPGDFVSNTIMDIRRSMADSSFVIPLQSKFELDPSSDTYQLDERMS